MIVSNPYPSLFGNYLTRTFSEIFPTVEEFLIDYQNSPFAETPVNSIPTTYLSLGYYLLLSCYANSHIASSDETQFKFLIFSTFFTHGPAWIKRLEIQDKIRNLSDDEITKGAKVINNQALNPGTVPTTEELEAINAQNTSNRKKSPLEAYASVLSLIKTDVSAQFIDQFKKFFITVLEPNLPLWYVTQNPIEGETEE